MHETTRALLRHLRDLPQVADPRLDWLFVNAWDAAGYPDLDAPEPDRLTPAEGLDALDRLRDPRLAELEGRIKTLFELAGSRRQDSDDQLAQITELDVRMGALAAKHAETAERVDAVYEWVKILNEQHALHGGELSDLRTSTASGLMRLTDRIKALEPKPTPPPESEFMPTTPGRYIRNPSSGFQTVDVWRGTDGVLRWGPMLRVDDPLTACWVGPAPAAPPPEPARFVPTEPGWYWVEQPDGRRYPAWWEPGFGRNAMLWLGPVAPYAPPTRTEEEARREPRRGDRWKPPHDRHYTVTNPSSPVGNLDRYVWDDGAHGCGEIGEPGETYLGNFAHELEAP